MEAGRLPRIGGGETKMRIASIGLVRAGVVTIVLAIAAPAEACHRCKGRRGFGAGMGPVAVASGCWGVPPMAAMAPMAPCVETAPAMVSQQPAMVPQQVTSYQSVTETVYEQVP